MQNTIWPSVGQNMNFQARVYGASLNGSLVLQTLFLVTYTGKEWICLKWAYISRRIDMFNVSTLNKKRKSEHLIFSNVRH